MGRLVDAITEGTAVSLVKERILALEARKLDLERLVAASDEPPPFLHPNMAVHYRRQVARLHDALTSDAHRQEAADVMRSLIKKLPCTRFRKGPKQQCRSNCGATSPES